MAHAAVEKPPSASGARPAAPRVAVTASTTGTSLPKWSSKC